MISFAVPSNFFQQYAGNEFYSMVAMLLLGIPLYVCATASTPIAAALVLKGLSPGAALVFLLAGPATNATTITVVTKLMGKKITGLYLITIASCSVLLGWIVDRIYASFHITTQHWAHTMQNSAESPIAAAASILLLVLIIMNFLPKMASRKTACGCEKPRLNSKFETIPK